jgi:ketosteroid isomerase-like protein
MSSSDHEKILNELAEQLKTPLEKYYDGNPMLYVELFSKNPNTTFFCPEKKDQFVGVDEIRALYEPMVGQIFVPGFEITSHKLIMSGETAILTYVLNEIAEDGSFMNEWQGSDVYEKQDGRWCILHSHWSIFPKKEQEG